MEFMMFIGGKVMGMGKVFELVVMRRFDCGREKRRVAARLNPNRFSTGQRIMGWEGDEIGWNQH